MTRGSIYWADLGNGVGSEQEGIRPVLIIQNNKGNEFSNTVIIAPLTTRIHKYRLPTQVFVSKEETEKNSLVLCEQIRTIDKQRLHDRICVLSKETMTRVDRAIQISLAVGV